MIKYNAIFFASPHRGPTIIVTKYKKRPEAANLTKS